MIVLVRLIVWIQIRGRFGPNAKTVGMQKENTSNRCADVVQRILISSMNNFAGYERLPVGY